MKLDKVQDPRGYLEKYSRKELEYLARLEGISDIQPGMPALLMWQFIAQRPPAKWPIPIRQKFGPSAEQLRVPPYDTWKNSQYGERQAQSEPTITEVNATDDLAKQWAAENATQTEPIPDKPAKRVPKIALLRRECKTRGIKWARTDKAVDLEAKLNGENTP